MALLGFIIAFMYVWFDTDAFVEWSAFLHLKFFKYIEFFETRNTHSFIKTYTDFLTYKYPNIFTGIITCPICLAVWLNILVSCVFYNRMGGFILMGWHIIETWVLYSFIRWILKKLNG